MQAAIRFLQQAAFIYIILFLILIPVTLITGIRNLKNILLKMLWLLPIAIVGYGASFVVSGLLDSAETDPAVREMFPWAVFVAVFICFVLYIPFLIISFRRRRSEKIQESAERIQMERYRIEEAELDLKKIKYKRTKCPYCGTHNSVTAKYCSSCGAPVNGDKTFGTGTISR